MEQLVCERCGKVIEGYTFKQVDILMRQHNLKHQRDDEYYAEKVKKFEDIKE